MTWTGDGPGGGPPLSVSEVGEEKVRQDSSRAKTFGKRKVAAGPVRGYVKLSDATKAFGFDFRGKTVLDIGSSTGGFTQYALNHGAKRVIAIEKGTNQMEHPLRDDPRIELHEKTDIFDVKTQATHRRTSRSSVAQNPTPKSKVICTPDVILADVSFLSLTKILKYAKIHISRSDTDFLVMLKPQFEAIPAQLHDGVVKNETIRRGIIKNFEQWLKQNGFIIVKKRDNDLKGKTGNKERFYWLRPSISTAKH